MNVVCIKLGFGVHNTGHPVKLKVEEETSVTICFFVIDQEVWGKEDWIIEEQYHTKEKNV